MYRLKSTGEIKSQGQIRSMYPNTSFPSQWTPQLAQNLGIDPILNTPAPPTTRYQVTSQDGIEQDSKGNWVWKWKVTEMSDADKASMDAAQALAVRSTRDKRLADCDWTQTLDAPVDRTKWANYRQALRDLPSQAGFPWNVTWPTKP